MERGLVHIAPALLRLAVAACRQMESARAGDKTDAASAWPGSQAVGDEQKASGYLSRAAAALVVAVASSTCSIVGTDPANDPIETAGFEVYVSNERSGDVTIIDGASLHVIGTVPLGKRPRGLALAPDGSVLYVALSGSPIGGPGVDDSSLPAPDRAADGIGVFDLHQRRLVRILPSGSDPEQVAVSADGRWLYVANEDAATSSIVDVRTGQVTATIPVGGEPEGVGVEPVRGRVWVTSEQDNAVFVIDPRSRRVVRSIEVGERPRAVTFLPDGSRAFVTAENGGTLSIIDTSTLALFRTIGIGDHARAMGVAVAPDGGTIFVSTGRSRLVVVVDAVRHVAVKSIDAGERPWGIAVSPDGQSVFTANGPSDDVSVVDVERGIVRAKILVGRGPWGVAIRNRRVSVPTPTLAYRAPRAVPVALATTVKSLGMRTW